MRNRLLFTMCFAAATSALPAQDAHPTLTVGTATAQRGQKVTGTIPVPAGVDAALDIPVAVVHGARPGPVLGLVAGSHGTEYASIIALEELIKRLDPAKVSGSVIIVPLVNIPSFQKIVPHLNPVDGKNMNRFYPGNPNGTQTDRASWAITKQVIDQSDHVIDFHGGDLDEHLRPFSYWTVTGNAAQDEASKQLVLAFGLPHIVVSKDRPTDPAASKYLENTATTRGKPSFTAEAGYAGTVDKADVNALVNGTLSVMAHLRMLQATRTYARPIWLTEMLTVAATTTGIFTPEVHRNQQVKQGQRLGHVTDYVGRELEVATAPKAGIILYVRPLPSLNPGETIATVGVPGKP
ncbi:MAG: succinylglutamate desuccinylase/aspartoacylase family protein [Gemmatimonadetes bacterium]|nr:succinylglutamate desuccinylase/aspartoacylase family protein [Gemmatimonadota bacterium]